MAASTVITRDVLAKDLQSWYKKQMDVDIPMTEARESVGYLFDHISSELTKGREIRIHGFGAFKTAQRAARMARNPRTGEAVRVAPRRVVRFSPSTTLSTALKSGRAAASVRKGK